MNWKHAARVPGLTRDPGVAMLSGSRIKSGARRSAGATLFVMLLSAFAQPAFAVHPDEILKDAVAEGRARHLSSELRCLVCQNQSIDDSEAPLARDLRILVRERITAGDSDDAIRKFLVARYGEFVLLKPPFEAHTFLLWTLPFLALAGGIAGIMLRGRRSSPEVAARPLSAEEQAALTEALRE